MNDYIANFILKYNHPKPRNTQHSPYKHAPIIYGAKVQYASKYDDSPQLYYYGILRVQSIVGALLFYGQAIDTFPPEFLQGWSASEVLYGNQWSPLALSVLDPKTG